MADRFRSARSSIRPRRERTPRLFRARLALAACLALPSAEGWAAPVAPSDGFSYDVRLEAETYWYRLYEVRFPSPRPSPFPANDTVWGHFYIPRRAPLKAPPAVLVLPVMAAPNVWIETRFMRELLRLGLAVLWIEMPYQFHRRPHPSVPSGQVFLARTARRLGENFRQAREDARLALSWLAGRAPGGRVGLFGVSLGAMVGSSLYATDARPTSAVFLLGGADFPNLLFSGEMTAAFVRSAGIRREELEKEWTGLDPLEHGEGNAGKRVLLINARGDQVIPADNALKLKAAFPSARQLWVPFGHYGAILHLSWVPSYVSWHLARELRR